MILIVAIDTALFNLFRGIFWLYFSNPKDPLSSDTLAQAFYIGFKYDLRLALFIVLPIFATAWIKPLRLFESDFARRLWIFYLTFALFLACLFYIFNFGHFAYLHTSLDATALRFLQNFSTSALMLWQSYPVILLGLGLLSIVAVYAFVLLSLVKRLALVAEIAQGKRRRVAKTVVVTFIMLFGMYGKLSWYPLRWSDAFTATHPFASAVTINPILYSLTTLKNKQIAFDVETVREYYPRMAKYLAIDNPDPASLHFSRQRLAKKRFEPLPNIVVVILESFASYKTGLGKNPLNPTPYFDAIAKNSIYFKNYFSPITGTARSVFAALTGLPDVEKVRTSTRNPLVVNQRLLINAFKGYEKMYFIGGSVSWGNIRGLLSHNIPGLRIFEEADFNSPRLDVWGISDLDLFKEANNVLKAIKTPFIAVVQTSGNHRPYSIPDGIEGFQLDQRSKEAIIDHGFASVEEFNSFRFMDYSVGNFINAARKEPYFNDTIFVFFGDHGIHAPAGDHTRRAEEQLNLQGLRVPLVIYAPKLLPQAKILSTMATEMDVFPTLASLVGISYTNTTIGRDLFDARYDKQRYAFTIEPAKLDKIGLLDEQFYFRIYTDGSKPILHDLSAENPRENVMAKYSQRAKEMEQICRGIYESTRYIRYHNAPSPLRVTAHKE